MDTIQQQRLTKSTENKQIKIKYGRLWEKALYYLVAESIDEAD